MAKGYLPYSNVLGCTAEALATSSDRLRFTLRRVAPGISDELISQACSTCLEQPGQLQDRLTIMLGDLAQRTFVAGTLDRRLILIEQQDGSWIAADLSGRAHRTRSWPRWAEASMRLHKPDSWFSLATVKEDLAYRLSRPRLLLTALYHPENFPLPRFPLGISDVARAARSTLLGQVTFIDMQLEVSLDKVLEQLALERPDILGLSVTFGQHDLMVRLLDALQEFDRPPLVVAGGSLTARNEQLLLEQYPALLIARGAGEGTIRDVLAHWHGDLALNEVRGLAYTCSRTDSSRRTLKTRREANVPEADALPELDLLDEILRHNGVAQLETSRGCTNFCSFCPRSHKGQWSGHSSDSFRWLLLEMSRVFDRHPTIPRTIFLVDEEFIGRDIDAVARVLAIGHALDDCDFQWETSCRVDQVVRMDRDRTWHLERAAMWRRLRALGLRRCLFGVESGVDTVLERFNKDTTAAQNVLAIRTLSALGIPTRFTYITFDHLMTEDELRRTCEFQGRTDLILKHLPGIDLEAIVDGVRDAEFVATHAADRPLYTAISYLLVSMECLIGAPYTRRVQLAGLAGPPRPSMGRLDASFADWRIGRCSEWAQRWVDRHFALDYTLKSLEKIVEGAAWTEVHGTRLLLREAAYRVLRNMIDAISTFSLEDDRAWLLDRCLYEMVDTELEQLRDPLTSSASAARTLLPRNEGDLLRRELQSWCEKNSWTLINASDPCEA